MSNEQENSIALGCPSVCCLPAPPKRKRVYSYKYCSKNVSKSTYYQSAQGLVDF